MEEVKEVEVQVETKQLQAPVVKRTLAFLIDAVVAIIPALTMYLVFAGGFKTWAPVYYESPIIGAVSMYDLPGEVNEAVNTITHQDGTTHTEYNVSFGATICRLMSVFSIAFYVFYSTFCAYIFDGQTVGKKFMKLRMIVPMNEETPEDEVQKKAREKKINIRIFLREVIGKVLINSIPIFPIISLFTMIFTKNRLTIHDMIGKTRVVEEIVVVKEN